VNLLERVRKTVERPANILEWVRYFGGGGVHPGVGAEISDGKGFVIPVRGIVIIVRASFDSAQEDARSLRKTPDPSGRRPIPQDDSLVLVLVLVLVLDFLLLLFLLSSFFFL